MCINKCKANSKGGSGKEVETTEKRLYQAFDLQRFSPNARLQAVIDASHRRTARELSDDELDCVAAAGDVTTLSEKQKEKP